MEHENVHLEHVPLATLRRLPRNPKSHDLDTIEASMDRFGFVTPLMLDERTGHLVAGHGRLTALERMRDRGVDPPRRVVVRDDGEWLVPVVRGVTFSSMSEAEAYAIADNRLTELGGWQRDILADTMRDHLDALDGLGFDEPALKALLAEPAEKPEKDDKRTTCPRCGHTWEP